MNASKSQFSHCSVSLDGAGHRLSREGAYFNLYTYLKDYRLKLCLKAKVAGAGEKF